jgi:hypothetical protein
MAKSPLFALADSKLARAKTEMARLAAYLEAYERSDLNDVWSRTATAAYAVHGVYNGLEDIMSDVAHTIDGSAPLGPASHQALLDQMRVGLEGSRPALLDDALYADLVELKAFRHLVRHRYGIDLVPGKVDANVRVAARALARFETALGKLKDVLEAS